MKIARMKNKINPTSVTDDVSLLRVILDIDGDDDDEGPPPR